MTILDRNAGTFNTATGFTVTRSTGSFGSGTVIVVAVVGNTVVNTPGSATQRTNSVVDMGIYSYDIAGAGQASIAFTNSSGSGVWFCWELSGSSTYVDGAANQSNSIAGTHLTSTVTPTVGNRHMLAAVGGVATSLPRSVTAFSNSFTITIASQQVSAQDWPFAAGADLDVVANGSTGYSTTATFSGNTLSAHGGVLLAYNNASAAPPVGPPLLVQQAVNRSYTY